jgi:hypothetical protein
MDESKETQEFFTLLEQKFPNVLKGIVSEYVYPNIVVSGNFSFTTEIDDLSTTYQDEDVIESYTNNKLIAWFYINEYDTIAENKGMIFNPNFDEFLSEETYFETGEDRAITQGTSNYSQFLIGYLIDIDFKYTEEHQGISTTFYHQNPDGEIVVGEGTFGNFGVTYSVIPLSEDTIRVNVLGVEG